MNDHSNDSIPGANANADPTRRCLHLLVQGLSEHDVAKLAAFLRLGADRLGCDWKMVFLGDSHVLLHGGDEPATVQGLLDDPVEIRRISKAGAAEPVDGSTLARPLQYDAVIETLLAAERKCGAAPAQPAVPARPSAAAVATLPPASLQAGARYRLRRWPNAELVQRSRDHLRVASFLSARHVDISELARLANVELTRCEEIIGALLGCGYLEALPAAQRAAGSAVAPAARPSPRATPDAGLFARIRRKFGLRGAP